MCPYMCCDSADNADAIVNVNVNVNTSVNTRGVAFEQAHNCQRIYDNVLN